jgi:hypothetical protein
MHEIASEMIISHGKKWYKNDIRLNQKYFVPLGLGNLWTIGPDTLKNNRAIMK